MPRDHGSQRRALKQRKRRQARRQARAGRKSPLQRAATGALPSGAAEAQPHGSYDPRRDPKAAGWLELDEPARLDAVVSYHEQALSSDRRPPNMATHASLHVMVENQLAADEPPAARVALSRLMRSGLTRHDGIHAIGWVAIDHLDRALKARQLVDAAAYAAALEQLTRESWLAAAGVEPEAGSLFPARQSD